MWLQKSFNKLCSLRKILSGYEELRDEERSLEHWVAAGQSLES